MKRIVWLAGLFVVGSSSLGCAGPVAQRSDGAKGLGAAEEGIAGDGASTYYVVTHADARKCASPVCGGVSVKRVNRATTRCADGVSRNECHMAALELSALGLTDAENTKYADTFAQRHGIVRGTLQAVDDGSGNAVDTVTATEAWVAATVSAPVGTFYGVSGNGITCVAAPCPSILEETLNFSMSGNIDDVDLSATGADGRQIEDAQNSLATGGILVAGANRNFTGPAGEGRRLSASQFYTRLLPGTAHACGGVSDPHCADGYVCDRPAGACDAGEAGGTCKLQGNICPFIYLPVCGCDGKTYTNDCMRVSAGVGLDHPGACGGGVACGSNTCGPHQYCCNAPCGMCAPMGAMCIQKFCN